MFGTKQKQNRTWQDETDDLILYIVLQKFACWNL